MLNLLLLAWKHGVLPTIDKIMNIRKIAFFTLFLPFIFVTQAQASGTNCVSMYGGGYAATQSCTNITIDKKVQKPGSKDFVDGLSGNDAKYNPGQEVNFQITVQNVGSDKITNLVVTDTLPQFVTFVAGPGSYDKNANKLTFVVASLESGQSQTIYIKTKIVDNVTFPDKGFTCVTNFVRGTEQSGINVDDSTLFCIERPLKIYQPVLGVKQTPSTGPEAAALPVLFGMGGFGWFLRKKPNS